VLFRNCAEDFRVKEGTPLPPLPKKILAREEGPEVLVMTRDSIEQESELTEDYPQISLFSVLFNWLFSWALPHVARDKGD